MSTQIGTATDYVDLMEKLDAFLCTTGHAWGKKFTGDGDGDLVDYLGTADSVAETFTLTCTTAGGDGVAVFSVVGSVTGALASATVGTPYTSANIDFEITAGATDYELGDVWTINTAPPWTRLRREGCPDTSYITTDLANPDRLNDGSVLTAGLATTAATTSYVEWEMIQPTKVRRIFAQAPSSTQTRMPTQFILRWKDNPGDSWTTAETFNKSPAWTTSEGVMFTTAADAGAHTFWRIEMSGATSSTAIGELQLYRDTTDLSVPVRPSVQADWAWQAPGLDGAQAVVVHGVTRFSAGSDVWNISFVGVRSWLAGEGFGGQPGDMPSAVTLCLAASPIGYWFVVNGQRAIVVAKVSGVYQTAYLGLGFPYEPPSVHAYPMVVAACSALSTERYSSNAVNFRHPVDPSRGTFFAYYPDSTWRQHSNRYASTAETAESPSGGYGFVWPALYHDAMQTGYRFNDVRPNIDDTRPMLPCVLANHSPAHTWGELDGLYWASGFLAAPEAIVREGVFDHLLITNTFRTGVGDFGAVRLD